MSHRSMGDRLRQARESMPASLHQAARETRIRLDYLEAMERGSFDFITGRIYMRGMLQAYGRWLKLDQEELGREFDALPARKASPTLSDTFNRPHWRLHPPRSRWLFGAATTGTVLLVLSMVGLMRPNDRVARPPAAPEPVPPAAAAPSPEAPPEEADSVRVAEAPAPPLAEGVRLTIEVTGDKCWTMVTADGSRIFERTLRGGDSRTFEADSSIKVIFGNLGAVRLTLNGRDLGTPGGVGQTGTFEFTPDTTSLQV